MKRQQTKYEPQSICLRAIYQIYFCGLGITLLVLSIIASVQLANSLDDYDYIISNWNQNVIMNVQVSLSDCLTLGNGSKTLATYNWPGTKPGCDCRDSTRSRVRRVFQQIKIFYLQELEYVDSLLRGFYPRDKIYSNHACNSTQEFYGCKTISSKGSKTFDKWTDASTPSDFYVCGTRVEGKNFINNIPQSNGCPDGQKRCGSLIDENNFFCTPSADQCPITQIGFSGIGNKQWKSQPIPSKAETIKINENFQLWYSREDYLPLVEFRVTESNGVCLRNQETNISPGRDDYVLMQTLRTSCSTDPRFKAMHSIDEQSFYRANNALDFPVVLKSYEINSDYKWGVFGRSFIDWKMSCRGDIYKRFLDYKATLDQIKESQMGLLIISIVFFVIISIVLSAISVANMCGFDWPCISGEGSEESNYIFTCEIITKVILQISQAVVILLAFSKVRDAINFFSQIIDMGCSDSTTNSTLQGLIDVLKEEVQNYNLGQLILFIITTIMDFTIGIIYCVRKRCITQSKYETDTANSQEVKGQELQIVQPDVYQPIPQNNIQMQQNNQDNPYYQDNPQLNNNPYQQPNMNQNTQQQQMNPYNNQQQQPYQQPINGQNQNPYSNNY